MPEETIVTNEAPEDFAAFEQWRNTGEQPEATPAAETPEPAPASDPVTPSGDDPQNGDKAVKGVQKRIDELTRARRDAERRAEDAERRLADNQGSRPAKTNAPAQAADPGKPKLEDFETLDAFQEALTDFKLDQREQQRAQKASVDSWNSSEQAFKEQHADYDEVLDGLKIPTNAPGVAVLQKAIAKAGPELLYQLAKSPDDALRIAGMADPTDALLELGAFKSKIATATPEKPKQQVSSAPRPPARVGGAAPAGKSLGDEDLDFSEHEKLMAAKNRRKK